MNHSEAGKLGAEKSKETNRLIFENRIKEYKLNPNLCATCQSELPYSKRHNKNCSHSCAAKTRNIGITRNPLGIGGFKKSECRSKNKSVTEKWKKKQEALSKAPEDRICLNCNKLIKNKENLKFCCYKCKKDYEWIPKKKQFLANQYIETSNSTSSARYARRLLKELHGHKCSICEIEEWRGQPTPLILDHIDGNSDNWSLDNLRLVCPNCDAQLPTYKSKNKGSGRAYRRKRYAEGKSY